MNEAAELDSDALDEHLIVHRLVSDKAAARCRGSRRSMPRVASRFDNSAVGEAGRMRDGVAGAGAPARPRGRIEEVPEGGAESDTASSDRGSSWCSSMCRRKAT